MAGLRGRPQVHVSWKGNCSTLNNPFSPGKGPRLKATDLKGVGHFRSALGKGSDRNMSTLCTTPPQETPPTARAPKVKRPRPLAGRRKQTSLIWGPSHLRHESTPLLTAFRGEQGWEGPTWGHCAIDVSSQLALPLKPNAVGRVVSGPSPNDSSSLTPVGLWASPATSLGLASP